MSADLFHPEPDERELSRRRFLRVAIERGLERTRQGPPGGAGGGGGGGLGVDAALTYWTLDQTTAAGDRVEVPLGKGDRRTQGMVVGVGGPELLEGLDPARVKGILRRVGPGLPPGLLALAEWIAGYYVCPLGMVLGTMMPAAVKRGVGRRVVTMLTPAHVPDEAARLEALTPALRRGWAKVQALAGGGFPMTPAELHHAAKGLSLAAIKKLVAAGLLQAREHEDIRARALDGVAPPSSTPAAHAGGPEEPDGAPPAGCSNRPVLLREQSAAFEGVRSSLGRFGVHLLLGVTGSGKTEVYLRVIESALEQGRSAIVLVPEIALTPQTSQRFIARFGAERLAVLHSGLTSAQRNAQWQAAAAGRVRVVVGARSAVFAPLTDVGVIVVDEEHDHSYKQDQLPRYHARDVAIKRAQLIGCPVVLGSATPSLESYANALEGKFRVWRLTERATGAMMPRVEIVDLAEERRARASGALGRDRYVHLLGPTLEVALERTLADGHQAILLLNRRGYANYICCPDQRCGWVMHCEDCDATMVFHRGLAGGEGGRKGFVRCHHCLAEQLLPKACPRCARAINTFGEGTQRVEEELERKFAQPFGLRSGETLLRLDSDTMRSARDYFHALDRFARGRARVLVGTQMIAKGLDFPGVRLVGVINADTALNMPDFRAAERTYQLVSQVAGRAGRGGGVGGAGGGEGPVQGRVIVQTMAPHAPAIVLAARHDYEAFAKQELGTRARAGVPPAARMARVVCRDADLAKAKAAAGALVAALREAATDTTPPPPTSAPPSAGSPGGPGGSGGSGGVVLRGPFPCPLSRVAQQHRIEIQLTAPTRGAIQALLQRVRAQGLLKSDAHTAVDVDPIALL
jgi:primosomal protein N' (replication factor Y)